MDDSWGRFWERLIVDAVSVLVVAFVLQGVWFAVGTVVSDWRPELEPGFRRISGGFLALWIVGVAAGLLGGVKRAWSAKRA